MDFPGVNHQISRGDQEKIMWSFQGSWFQAFKISEGCNTNLWSFYGRSLVLSGVSSSKVKNLKILGGLQRKGRLEALLPQILFDIFEILNRGSLPVREAQCLKNPSKF